MDGRWYGMISKSNWQKDGIMIGWWYDGNNKIKIRVKVVRWVRGW